MKNKMTELEQKTMKSTSGVYIYYKFECDDINRPSSVDTDFHFELSEYDEVLKTMEELDSKGLKYTLLLERFNELNDNIISRDYFVDNNHLNQ
jgi:hypothetical protein